MAHRAQHVADALAAQRMVSEAIDQPFHCLGTAIKALKQLQKRSNTAKHNWNEFAGDGSGPTYQMPKLDMTLQIEDAPVSKTISYLPDPKQGKQIQEVPVVQVVAQTSEDVSRKTNKGNKINNKKKNRSVNDIPQDLGQPRVAGADTGADVEGTTQYYRDIIAHLKQCNPGMPTESIQRELESIEIWPDMDDPTGMGLHYNMQFDSWPT